MFVCFVSKCNYVSTFYEEKNKLNTITLFLKLSVIIGTQCRSNKGVTQVSIHP